MIRSPIALAFWGLGIAGGTGIAYMLGAGAPTHLPAINAGAIVVAMALVWVRARRQPTPPAGMTIAIGVSVALLATALFGHEVEGIRRWWSIGPVSVNVALLALPALAVAYARRPASAGDRIATTAAMALAALALALQPNRGSAFALLLVTLVVGLWRRHASDWIVLVIAATAFAATVSRADPLDGVRFVEGVLAEGWRASPGWGPALAAASAALLLPLTALPRLPADARLAIVAFSAAIGGLVAASIIGQYPTPVVGAGLSAIVGYALGVLMFPRLGPSAMPGADAP